MSDNILSLSPVSGRTAGPLDPAAPGSSEELALRRSTAEALEASFLTVMLQSAGHGAAREAFGGGVGEAQFSSLLVEAHADALVQSGGIGLSEALFNALGARGHDKS